MKIYDDVRLNTELEELSVKGIHKGETGLLIEIDANSCLVMFLNSLNYGDYAFVRVNKKHLSVCEFKYDKKTDELRKMVATKDLTKDSFKPQKFLEYDCVELIVEKEKYAKYGVHKGAKGAVMEDKCIDSCYYVIFTDYNTGYDIADLSVHEDDLVLVKR